MPYTLWTSYTVLTSRGQGRALELPVISYTSKLENPMINILEEDDRSQFEAKLNGLGQVTELLGACVFSSAE